MPPKSRNVQLAAAWKRKKEIQLAESILLDKLSDDELTNDELMNKELSDNYKEDGIWNDDDLEETVTKITQSVFEIICQNAENPDVFINKRLLIYHGNFNRTKRRKKAAAKAASKGSASITTYFPSSLLNDPINTIVDDLINLEEVIEKEGVNLALEELNILIKDNSLISQVKNHLQLIIQ